MRIVSYDTGKMTGIGMWAASDDPLGVIWSAALERDEAENHMRANIPNADLVLVEKLVINANSHKKSPELVPAIELAGVAKHYARMHGKDVVELMPSEVMRFADDAKLKRIGWYVAGPDHQRDARRHILVFVSRTRLIDPSILLPKEV